MSEHTPGPWRISTSPPNGEQIIGAQNGMMVAVVTTGIDMKEETIANARLIAAAPEMLSVLEDVNEFLNFAWRDIEMNDYSFTLLEDIISKVQIQIAKIEEK